MQSADSDESARLKALDEIAHDWHVRAPTTDAHMKIAIHLWAQIKSLGYTSGRLLAVGQDADLLAGHPPGTPRTAQAVGPGEAGLVLSAGLPQADQWPHPDLRLEPAATNAPVGSDVMIANLPYADTRFLDRSNQIDIALEHHRMIRIALSWLRPGGLLVALAHRQLLDGTDAEPRRSIAQHADLLGAVRLPASALRAGPFQDSPADLLLLRRREPSHPASGLPFIDRSPVHVHGRPDMLINACYANEPWFALGTIVPDPIDPDLTTVAPANGNFEPHLSDVLDVITDAAIHHETTAHVRPTRGRPSTPPPPGRPAAPGPDPLGI
ncbi:hypothetical protein APR04_000682 [Promicromonospora umidemergens]|uniref:Methyltransferase family protein n=1 Tax=Promicromonospora umidemergens TaxID=629679 RepID=A0ABP8XED5_9MICO|nr:hypothetical protein [Promicromonospora umidemergens]MCP2281793.1 hypothetical protein [Promicromonospora umidemergens]